MFWWSLPLWALTDGWCSLWLVVLWLISNPCHGLDTAVDMSTHFLQRKALSLTRSTNTKEWCCMAITERSWVVSNCPLLKKVLIFLENKGLLLNWNPFRSWWIGSGGFMLSKNRLYLFWKCLLQNSSEIRSYGLVTSLFYVNSYLFENGISVHLLLN